jgi:hypothetical protein
MNRSIRLAEEKEVEAVLSSSLFAKSKLHSRLLKYLADHYFGNSQEQLKEFTIAVEALNRPESFDSREDSSVRVMMHRLRARINQFYEGEGKHHQTRIILEDGHYTLQFSHKKDDAPEQILDSTLSLAQPVHPANQTKPSEISLDSSNEPLRYRPLRVRIPGWLLLSAAALSLLVLFISVSWYLRRDKALLAVSGRQASSTPVLPVMETDDGSIRILCGNLDETYKDSEDHRWGQDRFFVGGTPVQQQFSYLQGTNDANIYKHARAGSFQYNVPVQNRSYELHLHFSEVHFGPATDPVRTDTSRLFDIGINHATLFHEFDILSNSGSDHRALTRIVRDIRPDKDGMVHLQFINRVDQAMINGIELIPQDSNAPRPIRIVTQAHPMTDDKGVFWGMDQYYLGGSWLDRHAFPEPTVQSHLYNGERFGHFSYQIPVAPGCYSVKLHFIERHFGQKLDSPFGDLTHDLDGRLFDILANGVVLKANVNILRLAGGPNKPVALEFHNVPSNAAGQILLEFNPSRNYAFVNAIEITYEDAQCTTHN